jgi:hypothetical protein
MMEERSPQDPDLTFFDLFVNGLTDGAEALYFGMDLYCELLEYGLGGYSISIYDHEFLRRYVDFVVALNLARFDYTWFDEVGDRWDMTGQLLGRLTKRGQEIVSYIRRLEMRLPRGDSDLASIAQERFVRMDFGHSSPWRLERIRRFKLEFPRVRTIPRESLS